MARRWRVVVAGLDGAPGRRIELPADEAHHLRRVLRLRPGDEIGVLDGAGGEWAGTLDEVGAAGVTAVLERPIDDPVESPLTWRLWQGNCRPDRMDWVVQKATELGVASIHPVVGPGGAGRAGRAAGQRRQSRWRRIAAEACKQCGRRLVPQVEPVDDWPLPETGRLGLLLDPAADAAALAKHLDGQAPEELWIAVGPEEGFADGEPERLVAGSWRRVSLGPRILRTETAGLVAAALVLQRWGDLGGPV